MTIEKIRKEHELIDLFCNLAEVPSPSMLEEKVAQWIKNYCDKNKINCKFDDFGNVVINIPATDTTKAPLMLSAHMDVIGDDSTVKTYKLLFVSPVITDYNLGSINIFNNTSAFGSNHGT